MHYQEKLRLLERFYARSWRDPAPVAVVATSGSYAAKVRAWANLGKRTQDEVERLCAQVEHLRRAFKVIDDILDEDTVRDGAPAFWCLHGVSATIEQAAWHLKEARAIALSLGTAALFERRLCEVIGGARLEVEMEAPDFSVGETCEHLWMRIVEKEAAFRRYLAEALLCRPEVCEAAHRDGIAAQVLDDARSALYGKDGRPDNSDERLGRLTYMAAYRVSAQEAEHRGLQMKAREAPSLRRNET
jgi:geranylgeranyl pyrophosphate synthase